MEDLEGISQMEEKNNISVKSLCYPPLVALSFLLYDLMYGYFIGPMNVHGGAIFFIMIFMSVVVVGLCFELFAVPLSIIRMRENSDLRTKKNVALVSVGLVYIILTGLLVLNLLKGMGM